MKPRLLIVSFSHLVRDARLLKQIRAFTDDYQVTTCGFGQSPHSDVEHIELTPGTSTAIRRLEAIGLHTHAYRFAYWVIPFIRQARRLLAGRTFDAVIANDLDTAGLALKIAPSNRIHLDLHEFWPGIHDDVPAWTTLRVPYYSWQLRTWGRRMRSVTTINAPLAERYEADFGIQCDVVTNASEYQELTPTEVQSPLRLVHSGGAQPNRKIERMMRAVARSESAAILDLYLVGEGTEYHRSLQALAEELGERVTVLSPVGHAELIETLNRYDVGLPFLPPTTTNIRMTLPNKFFDYVQARLAILTGPTPPMVELIEEHDLGVVTDDFEEDSLVRAIDALDVERVRAWKQHAHEAAAALSGELQNRGWVTAVQKIVELR